MRANFLCWKLTADKQHVSKCLNVSFILYPPIIFSTLRTMDYSNLVYILPANSTCFMGSIVLEPLVTQLSLHILILWKLLMMFLRNSLYRNLLLIVLKVSYMLGLKPFKPLDPKMYAFTVGFLIRHPLPVESFRIVCWVSSYSFFSPIIFSDVSRRKNIACILMTLNLSTTIQIISFYNWSYN